MAAFSRRFHWGFLTFWLFTNYIGAAAIAGGYPCQQPEAQDPSTSPETSNFDAFLDTHPDIDAQLRTNPLLINDQKWVHDHPEVLVYFDRHPQAKKEIAGSPSYFIRREGRRASREAREQNENLHKDEAANFRQFLSSNPTIRGQLNADPLLVQEPRYLAEHPGLQAFLYDHPLVTRDLRENPDLFFQRRSATMQKRSEAQGAQGQDTPIRNAAQPEARREEVTPDHRALEATNVQVQTSQYGSGASNTQTNPANSELVSFHEFLAEHKRINKDLEKDPARVNDTKYLTKHRDLRDYLNRHTSLREGLSQDAAYFMDRRNGRDPSRVERTIVARSVDNANSASFMTRTSQKDLRAADRFLEKHKNINKDLEKNPALVADPHYLKKHKDFRQFLEQNPDLNAAMRRDPALFMQNQHARFERMHQKM
jgi:hypothetical protein